VNIREHSTRVSKDVRKCNVWKLCKVRLYRRSLRSETLLNLIFGQFHNCLKLNSASMRKGSFLSVEVEILW